MVANFVNGDGDGAAGLLFGAALGQSGGHFFAQFSNPVLFNYTSLYRTILKLIYSPKQEKKGNDACH